MDKPDDVKMMSFHIPDDDEWLAHIGSISIAHGHLDFVLRYTIKTLTDVTPKEALDATEYTGSKELRRRIKQLARKRLEEGPALVKLQALMTRCERATRNRNDLIHNVCGKEQDGEVKMRDNDHEWKPLPSISELNHIQAEITSLTKEINAARLGGFLQEALN